MRRAIVVAALFASTCADLPASPVFALVGCASASHASNAAVAGTYAGELALCVQRAETRAASEACRCDVSRRWGRACDDGGVP